MESAPFGVSRLKCGSGKRRERRRFWIPVGAAHRAVRGIQVSHTFFQPRKGDPRGRPSMRGTARPGGRALQTQFRIQRRGQAPALQVGKLPWRADTWGRPHSPPEPVGAHSMRPPGFAPGTPGDREGRPYGDIRTRSVGSANSGAVRKPHQEQILPHSGPSGPAGNQAFTQILRAGNGTIPFRRGPRKWGPGCATWSTGTVLLGANPGDPLGTFPSLGKYLAPQGETLQNRAAKSPCD